MMAEKTVDVLAALTAKIKANSLSWTVGNDLAGDPAVGIPKRVYVEYTAGGVAHIAVQSEGWGLTLPGKGETGPLVLTRAVYGVFAGVAPPPVAAPVAAPVPLMQPVKIALPPGLIGALSRVAAHIWQGETCWPNVPLTPDPLLADTLTGTVPLPLPGLVSGTDGSAWVMAAKNGVYWAMSCPVTLVAKGN